MLTLKKLKPNKPVPGPLKIPILLVPEEFDPDEMETFCPALHARANEERKFLNEDQDVDLKY